MNKFLGEAVSTRPLGWEAGKDEWIWKMVNTTQFFFKSDCIGSLNYFALSSLALFWFQIMRCLANTCKSHLVLCCLVLSMSTFYINLLKNHTVGYICVNIQKTLNSQLFVNMVNSLPFYFTVFLVKEKAFLFSVFRMYFYIFLYLTLLKYRVEILLKHLVFSTWCI